MRQRSKPIALIAVTGVALLAAIAACSKFSSEQDPIADAGTTPDVEAADGPIVIGEPDHGFTFDAEELAAVQGRASAYAITVKRRSTADSAITITATSLPNGVSIPSVVVPKGVSVVKLITTASTSSTQGEYPIKLEGISDYKTTSSVSRNLLVRGAPGTLDRTFANDGVFVSSVGIDGADLRALSLQADGKILAAGNVRSSGPPATRGMVLRVGPDGKVDGTFATQGAFIDDASFLTFSAFNGVQAAPAGIWLTGKQDTDQAFVLLRLKPTGVYDETLTIGRKNLESSRIGGPLAPGPANTLYANVQPAVGFACSIVRILPTGEYDTLFGTAGAVPSGCPSRLTPTEDGGILMAYNAGTSAATVGKYSATGVATSFNSSDIGGSSAAAMLPDGKVVATYSPGGAEQMMRELADFSSIDTTFGTGGKVILSAERTVRIFRQSDGQLVVAYGVENQLAVERRSLRGRLIHSSVRTALRRRLLGPVARP